MPLPKEFWLLWFGQTLNRVGTLGPAFLVLYVQQRELASAQITPAIIGLFGVGVVISGLLGGVLADLIGSRRTILSAQPAAILTALSFLLAHGPISIGLLAFLAGLLSAIDRPAGAGFIARVVAREQYPRAYSLYMIGFNVGMSAAPVLSGLLLDFYPPGLFLLWALSSIVYAGLAWRLPPDAPVKSETGTGAGGTTVLAVAHRVVRDVAGPFRSPVMLAFLGMTFLLACVYLQVNSALPLNMRDDGLGSAEIGVVLAVNAVLSIALLPIVPRLVTRMRDETPLVIAALLIGLGFGMHALADNFSWFVAGVVVWTLGEVFFAPMSSTFLAKRAPVGRVSTYQGAYFFAWNAAFVIGAPLGPLVANAFGYSTLWIGMLALGIIAAVGFRLMARIPEDQIASSGDPELTANPEGEI
jgi:MFS family permease